MKKILFAFCICFISCQTTKHSIVQDNDSFIDYTEKLVFKSGTDELIEDYNEEIVAISNIIKNTSSDFSFEISGHTDSVGNKDLNLALSQKRAEKIKKLLIAQGCKSSQLIAKGYGETRPLTSNSTKKGRKRNRRIEISTIKL